MSNDSYRDRVLGCWLGKAAGGTLGMPYEGHAGPLNLTGYDPVPTGMVPNDDLDLQLVWACVLDRMERPRVDSALLGQAWLDHVTFPMDEYGVAIRNLRQGIPPPLSGWVDNGFTRGMGAAIRSELWACLAPGNPAQAAAYAYADACVDHAGEGIWAEVFLASLEAAAFAGAPVAEVIDAGLCLLPPDSELRQALARTVAWWRRERDVAAVRGRILAAYGHENFTDVIQNLGFIVLGLLAGDGDFGRTVCAAVNCGQDTDCTGATTGAICGILNPAGIGEEWLKPIGRNVILSSGIHGIEAPRTLDELTDLVTGLRAKLAGGTVPDAVRPLSVDYGVVDASELADTAALSGSRRARLLAALRPAVLHGTFASLPREAFAGEAAVIRYRVHEPAGGRRRIMLNSRGPVRLWLDGAFLSGSDRACALEPSFHRGGIASQVTETDMAKGEHEIIALIARPATGETVDWVFGIGEVPSNQWVVAGNGTGAEREERTGDDTLG